MLQVPSVTGHLSEHFADDAYGTLEGYERLGGYKAARQALSNMSPDEVIEVCSAWLDTLPQGKPQIAQHITPMPARPAAR